MYVFYAMIMMTYDTLINKYLLTYLLTVLSWQIGEQWSWGSPLLPRVPGYLNTPVIIKQWSPQTLIGVESARCIDAALCFKSCLWSNTKGSGEIIGPSHRKNNGALSTYSDQHVHPRSLISLHWAIYRPRTLSSFCGQRGLCILRLSLRRGHV